MNREDVKKSIQNSINNGLLDDSLLLIQEYKNLLGVDEDIASMETIIYICKEEYDNALKCIKEGLRINIVSSDLYYSMGNISEIKGDYNRAYLCYEQALYLGKDTENKQIIEDSISKMINKVNVNRVSLVIPTYNNLEYTKTCLNSIRKYNDRGTYEIIIVDNNSTDGTVEWLKEQTDINVIFNNENKGFPVGCNQGITIAEKSNDILLLNNDTVIMQNSIFNLRMALYSEENIGATGAVSNNVSYYQQIEEQFSDFDGYSQYSLKNNIPDEERYERRVKLIGFAMLIKRSVLNKVGLLDERFTPGNFEDDDLSFRILKEGCELLLCRDSFILHFGSVSFGEKPLEYINLFKENSNKFKEKWGFSIEYSTSIRQEIIGLLQEDKDRPIRVLEVGCACGATLLEIKNQYKNAEIYGIELNENSAKIAECFADVRAENIENTKLSYDEEFFDYIIFADVLEHLYDPALVLENMKKYLKKDGCIITSIPNVMHYSVIKELLSGNWTYQDSGILDRTHVRFFTLNEVVNLFGNLDYKINHIGATNVGINAEDEELISYLTKINGVAPKDQFQAYQYIVKAAKK